MNIKARQRKARLAAAPFQLVAYREQSTDELGLFVKTRITQFLILRKARFCKCCDQLTDGQRIKRPLCDGF